MNVGRIPVSEKLILKWLDFDGGEIINIYREKVGILELVISHPDMPEVQEGGIVPPVIPLYVTTTDSLGHSVTIREKK